MSKRSKLIEWSGIIGVTIILLSLITSHAFAQLPTATILGVVKDPSGAIVPDAEVKITNTDTGLNRTMSTGADGSYRFPALPVGQYQVQVTKNGFQTFNRTGITLQVGQDASIDVAMQVGSMSQSVTVTAQASLVQTTTSTIGSVVSPHEITSLPLNGRNMSDLTLLNAGVVQTYVFSPTTVSSGLMTGVTESNNGMPFHSNNYMLDGAIMKSPWGA